MKLFGFLSSPFPSKKGPSTSSSSISSSSSSRCKHALSFGSNEELEQTLLVFDANGDGHISVEEMKASMRCFFTIFKKGKEPSEEELAFMVAEVDKNGDGFLTSQEFQEFLFTSSSSSSSSFRLDEGLWFHAVDLNNDGVISSEELHKVMVQNLGIKSCTLHECSLIISSYDSDGDGLLNAQEFRKLLLS